MENFAVLTDAGGDFTRELIQKYGIEETPLSTIVWPDDSDTGHLHMQCLHRPLQLLFSCGRKNRRR